MGMSQTQVAPSAREAVDNSPHSTAAVTARTEIQKTAATGDVLVRVEFASRRSGRSQSLQTDAVILHTRGISVDEIAQRFGVRPRTVWRWIATPPPGLSAAHPLDQPDTPRPALGDIARLVDSYDALTADA